jgi:hypothetical protein
MSNGAVYIYEFTGGIGAHAKDGAVYAYEFVGGIGTHPLSGAVYAYENTVPSPNPMIGRFWDGAQWVQDAPWVWTGTAWQQQSAPLPSFSHPFLLLGL